MTLSVRYATTEDGVRIAYAVRGEGVPLIFMPLSPMLGIEVASVVPALSAWQEGSFPGRTQVIYDWQGFGYSQDIRDWSLCAQVADLAAVLDAVSTGQVALFAPLMSGPPAIAYAVRHPDRVSHLILWCTFASGRTLLGASRVKARLQILRNHPQLFVENPSAAFLGQADPAETRPLDGIDRPVAGGGAVRGDA